ncbi:signal peptide peptidase-like 2A isoform X3 [Hypomesus transpacificus]|uniref:signal peptide peptidase-like 2A isoform X3 n=1 Tax=Hypomesus transpacificus TaxID=137520 RepID=UPI001F071988|nr:signal peptide peptidase-like 2A isoform X3 [Hypomesus transpacificus]
MANTVVVTLFSIIFLALEIHCQEAVLHVSDGSTDKEYCLVYNSTWSNLSVDLSTAMQYPLVNLTSSLLCNGAGLNPVEMKGKVLVVMRGECVFTQKALIAQDLGAAGLLIASTENMYPPGSNDSEYERVHIPVALMRYRDFLDAHKVFGDRMQVKMYAPQAAILDVSIIVMLAIAVFTVAMGGYWSGASERERVSRGPSLGGGDEDKADSGDLSLYSPVKVVIFVALMCVMLVLMYFFYKWLVYLIIAIFCLASATALFSCLDAVMDRIGCGTLSFSVKGQSLSLRSVVLAAVCITVAVVWGVYRNEDRWIWILQDLLGIVFCLNFMKTITLSNFKICVILLGLLLVYDVFFVFITPFFTPNGESIMVQVALGPDAAGEKLPVVMRVPRISSWAQNMCGMQFSILGYGDIIVPGLLVAYCSRFDVWTNSPKKIYFVSCCVAYLCGMVVTFAVMLTTKMGQPALLYLVPFTLASSALLAWRRGEFRHFWSGTTYEVLDSSREPLLTEGATDYSTGERKC